MFHDASESFSDVQFWVWFMKLTVTIGELCQLYESSINLQVTGESAFNLMYFTTVCVYAVSFVGQTLFILLSSQGSWKNRKTGHRN